jgi:hypothetical protein
MIRLNVIARDQAVAVRADAPFAANAARSGLHSRAQKGIIVKK